MSGHERIEAYVKEVCSRIRAPRSRREDIAMELKSHLADLLEEEREHFGDRAGDAAGDLDGLLAQRAIERMGDPEELGRRLDHVHKPPLDWPLILGAICLAGLGIFAMWAIQLADPRIPSPLLNYKLAATGIGAVLMVILCLMDYRIFGKFGIYLYGLGVLVLAFTLMNGIEIMAQRHYLQLWGVTIDAVGAAPFWFALAYTGMLRTVNVPNPFKSRWPILLAVPALLILKSGSLMSFLEYSMVCAAVLVFWGVPWKGFVMFTGTAGLVLVWRILPAGSIGWERFAAFLNPEKDPNGSGYFYLTAQAAIRQGGWLGRGIGARNPSLPSIQSDMTFPFLTYTFGWLAAVLLLLAIAGFLVYGVRLAGSVRDPSGRFLAAVLVGLLGFKFAWHILMSVGILPAMSAPLPFLSYGGWTGNVMPMAAIGLLFSIRRNGRSPTASGPERNQPA